MRARSQLRLPGGELTMKPKVYIETTVISHLTSKPSSALLGTRPQ